jgi:hypothetical protein
MSITSVIILAMHIYYIWREGNIQSKFFMQFRLRMTMFSAVWSPYFRYIGMHHQSMYAYGELRVSVSIIVVLGAVYIEK